MLSQLGRSDEFGGLLHYMSADRPDCCFMSRVLGRGTKTPTQEHWKMFKRLGRYLIDKRQRDVLHRSEAQRSEPS